MSIFSYNVAFVYRVDVSLSSVWVAFWRRMLFWLCSSYIVSLAAISLLPSLYIYIQAYIKNELKTTKLLFYLGLTMFITVVILYILYDVEYNVCKNTAIHAWICI